MKLGVCTTFDKMEEIINLGYDFVELNMQQVMKLSEEEFQDLVKKVKENQINVYAFNSFLPSDLKVTGNHIDTLGIHAYVFKAMNRAYRLGGKVIVFGSGGSRRVEGIDFDTAKKQIVEFLTLCHPYCEKNNLTIVVEPLNKGECNIINHVSESLEIVKKVDRPKIKQLVDLYHMVLENEDVTVIDDCKNLLAHVHIAEPKKRSLPKSLSEYDYESFFKQLKSIQYDGAVSLECSWELSDLKETLKFLKEFI